MSNYGLGFLSATAPWDGSAATSISFTDTASNTTNTDAYTFTGQSIGSAASNRIVVVSVYLIGVSSTKTVTIGGIAATEAVTNYYSTPNTFLGIYYAAVPTGTTATVFVESSGKANRCAISVYRLIPSYSSSALYTVSTTAIGDASLNEITGGSSVYAYVRDSSNSYTISRNSSTLTPDVSSVFGGSKLVKFGNFPVTGNPNAQNNSTYSSSTADVGIVVAHWR